MSRALPTVERRMLDYKNAAIYLGISLRGMKELASKGKIPKVLIGHRVLFDRDDLDAFIEKIKRSA